MPDRAVVIQPGGGVRTGNVEFLGLSEHSPRFNVSVITMAPGAHGPEMHSTRTRTTRSTSSTAS